MTTTSFYNFLFSIAIIFSAESVSAKKVDVPFYRKSEKLVVSYDEFRRMRPVKQEQWIKAVQDFYVNLEKIEKGERVGYVAIEFQPIDSFAWLTVKALVPKICTTAELLLGTSKAYALTPSELPQQKVDAALAESRKAEAARKKLIELNAQLKKEGDKLNYANSVLSRPNSPTQDPAFFQAEQLRSAAELKRLSAEIAALDAEKIRAEQRSKQILDAPAANPVPSTMTPPGEYAAAEIKAQKQPYTADQAAAAANIPVKKQDGLSEADMAAWNNARDSVNYEKDGPIYGNQGKPLEEMDKAEAAKLSKADQAAWEARRKKAGDLGTDAGNEKFNSSEEKKKGRNTCIYAGWIQQMPDTINAKDRGSRCPRVSKMTVGNPPDTFACDGSANGTQAAAKPPVSGPKPSDAFITKPRSTTSANLPEPAGAILRQPAANSKATVLCNPVVFGLVDLANKKPLCVEPSASVTKTCAEKSKAQELKVAEMIKKYPEEYRVVTSRVTTLCTGDNEVLKSHFKSMGITDARQIENSVSDLSQTCEALKNQLSEVSGKYESSGQSNGGI